MELDIGFIAGLFTTFAYAPQLWKAARSGSLERLPYLPWRNSYPPASRDAHAAFCPRYGWVCRIR